MSSTTSGRDFEEYERLVHKILEEKIREEYPGAAIQVFHNRKYRGQSGQEHQIDVSAELKFAGCRVLILAECKKYRDKVGNEDVLTLLGRIRDIGAGKGMIVTPVGYQEGAKRLAEANGIALALAKSEESVSWEVVMPLLFPPLVVAGAELVMRAHRKRESEPKDTLTSWTEGGTSTWASRPQGPPQLQQGASASPAAVVRSQDALKSALPIATKAGAAGGAPALAHSIGSEATKTPDADVPAAKTSLGDQEVRAHETAPRTLRQPIGPNDGNLAALGSSLAKGRYIERTPLIHSGIFGSLWPFKPPFGPIPYYCEQPLADLASSLEELIPNAKFVEQIVAYLSKYESRGATNEFPDGLPFSLQFVPEDTILAVGSGPVSQVYLSHIAFWIALYGDPGRISGKFPPNLDYWRHSYPWFMRWRYHWHDYPFEPYWFGRHWPFPHLSYESLFLVASGKLKSKEEAEVPWKEILGRVISREKAADDKPFPPA
jgi:hypothetical protein